ncbi:hypothetical protein KUTeg_017767 [Tegillarca granosa]|uniref:Uncharacterized protein n=1 Tax=Tegillarca granosa TaxID=220873 RepID=A0ABQ9EHG9_TEGGR|nr:hypothetical protein KUTeg_017767 [Tegillarca granosa]
MLPLQISLIFTTYITIGYAIRGEAGYGRSRWFTKTVHDYVKPPEPSHLRNGPQPIEIVPTQSPKMRSTLAPQNEYSLYPHVVDYYDPHPADKRSYPFESGMQNMFLFTDPVEGEPFHVSYVQPPPVESRPYEHAPFRSQRNGSMDGKSGVYPGSYRSTERQPFKNRHSNSYMQDSSFFMDLFSNRGFKPSHNEGLKPNNYRKSIAIDYIISLNSKICDNQGQSKA